MDLTAAELLAAVPPPPGAQEWVTYLRVVQVAVLVVTLSVLGARVNKWWCTRWRCLLPAAGTGAIALLVAIGNVDALLHDRPGGFATVAITLASFALLFQACTIGLGAIHPHGLHDGGDFYQADKANGEPTLRRDRPSQA